MLAKSKIWPLFIGLVLTCVGLFYFYPKVFRQPNEYLLSASGDGIKNYYTFSFFINNDTSFINTKAANYPFGEHFAYLDAQPLFSFTIKILKKIFPSVGDYTVAIVNLLIFLSVVVAYFFLYKIIICYNVNEWLAALFALGVLLLSPQFYRIYGHYSLSYMWVIPATFFFFLNFNKSLFYQIGSFILLLFVYLIHNYFGLIASALFFVAGVVNYLLNRKELKVKYLLKIVAIPFLVTLIIFIFTSVTDKHIERTTAPYGVFTYHSNFRSVFLPVEFVIHKLFYGWLLSFTDVHPEFFEGVGYVGVFVNIYLIVLLIILLFKERFEFFRKLFTKDFILLLIVSAIFLLVALEKPIEKIIVLVAKVIPMVRQFRSLGRFIWVFYYLINIAMLIFVYRMFLELYRKNKKIVNVLLFVPMFLIFIEAYAFQNQWSKLGLKDKNVFLSKNLPNDIKKSLDSLRQYDFQAIMPLPFYHYGSEDFSYDCGDHAIHYYTMLFSYHLNLPSVSSNLSRTSVEETRQILSIFLPEFYPKPIQEKFNDKPLLVIYLKNSQLNPEEERIFRNIQIIGHTNDLILGILWPKDLFEFDQTEVLTKFTDLKKRNLYKNGYYVSDTSAFVFYDSFDTLKSDIYYLVHGAFKGNKRHYNTLAFVEANKLKPNKTYVVSFWYYNKGFSRNINMFVIEEISSDGKAQWIKISSPVGAKYVNGYWSLLEVEFVPKADCSYKFLFPKNIRSWQNVFYVDDFLIRPDDVDVFVVINDRGVLYNNHFIYLRQN